MMPHWFLIPAGVALVLCPLAALLLAKVQPAQATKALTILMVTTAVASVAALAGMALAYVTAIPWVDGVVRHCPPLHMHHGSVAPIWGITSLSVLVGVVALVGRSLHRQWRLRTGGSHEPVGPDNIELVNTAQAIAYAQPGRRGHIVVSTGMLEQLTLAEQEVLLAHERAHLDHGHSRYLLLAELASVAVPLLRPLRPLLVYATERWADEATVQAIGDQRLVARTIAKAALANHDFGAHRVLAFASWGVAARVQALTQQGDRSRLHQLGWVSCGSAVLLGALAASSLQLHHVALIILHLCTS